MSKYKKNRVYFYQLVPKIPAMDKTEMAVYKKRFKNAFLFKTQKEFQVNEGSVSGVKGNVLKDGLIGGAIIFTLEHNLPPKYNPSNQTPAELDLEGFRGLGYDSAYVYDPELMVLAIESRRPGVTLNNLRSLLFMHNNLPGFEYLPISYSDSYQKFLQSNGVKSLKMKMLRVTSEADHRDYERGVKEIKNLVDDMNGAQITIHVTARNKKDTFLNKEKLQDWAQQALNKVGFAHPIESFELRIEDVDSEKIVPIDLISGRIFEWTQIEKVRLIDRFSITEKIEQIRQHLEDKRDTIREFVNG